jgi:hypothetical protein
MRRELLEAGRRRRTGERDCFRDCSDENAGCSAMYRPTGAQPRRDPCCRLELARIASLLVAERPEVRGVAGVRRLL